MSSIYNQAKHPLFNIILKDKEHRIQLEICINTPLHTIYISIYILNALTVDVIMIQSIIYPYMP